MVDIYKLIGYTGDELRDLLDRMRKVQHTSTSLSTYVLTHQEYLDLLAMKSGTYTLPPATISTLGGIKVGDGLEITKDGLLSSSIKTAKDIPTVDNNDNFISTNVEDIVNELFTKLLSLNLSLNASNDLYLRVNDKGKDVDLSRVSLGSSAPTVIYSVKYTLAKGCNSSNNATEISSDSSYRATIMVEDGYKLENIKVTMGGNDVTLGTVSGNTININIVTGNIEIVVSAYKVYKQYNVRYILNNCKCSNSPATVIEGGNYITAVVASDGYRINTIKVTMNGSDVSGKVVKGESIIIDEITGDIEITANAIVAINFYSIDFSLTACTTSNKSTTLAQGSSYQTTITADEGYTVSNIMVTMGGVDISSTGVISGNNISIGNVTGDVVITAIATRIRVTYTITTKLSNVRVSNSDKTVVEGTSYNTIVQAEEGYTIQSCIVTMGGNDITSTAYRNNRIEIPNVTGNIVITAIATVTPVPVNYYNVTYNLGEYATSNNTLTRVEEKTPYNARIQATSGYLIAKYSVTMGGVDITSTAYNDGYINISSVTGDIVITVETVKIPVYYVVTTNYINALSKTDTKNALEGSTYTQPITVDDGFTISKVTVSMGDNDITSSVYSDGVVTIPKVTADITITITVETIETPVYYVVTTNYTNAISKTDTKNVLEDSTYTQHITVDDGFIASKVIVSMGGVDITSTAYNDGVITIPKVTGNVVITVEVKSNQEEPKPPQPEEPIEDELEILPSMTYTKINEGSNESMYVKLSSKPSSDTNVTISSSSQYLSCSTSMLTFTTSNWYISQSVNLTASSDSNDTNDRYTITLAASGMASKTITVDVIDAANSNLEVLYDNGKIPHGNFTFNSAINYGSYIEINQNQNASVVLNGYPLALKKNDKVYLELGLGTTDPSTIYSMRIGQLGDSSANNISGSNMLNESEIANAMSGDRVTTYWTVANDLSNINLTITAYYARVKIYKIYIDRG